MKTASNSLSDDQQEITFPHCHKVQLVAGMVECDERPSLCKWFLSFGDAGFCRHPEAMQLVAESKLM